MKTEPNMQLSLFGCLFHFSRFATGIRTTAYSVLFSSSAAAPRSLKLYATPFYTLASAPLSSQPHAARMFSSLPRRRLLTVPHPQRLVCRCCRHTFSLPQVPAPSSPPLQITFSVSPYSLIATCLLILIVFLPSLPHPSQPLFTSEKRPLFRS